MNACATKGRKSRARKSRRGPRIRLQLLVIAALAASTGEARAQPSFLFGDEPVHPACVHALTMHQGESVPIITAVTLVGCASSERSRIPVRYDGDYLLFEDPDLLGGGSFGYRELTQLENGIFGLVIRRMLPDGEEKVSLAAVKLVDRPMVRHGDIVHMQQVELLGEIWIPGMDELSFRSMGNIVHFVAGTGPDRVERRIDFTRLGKLRQ